jgi:glc operon protein GlcG
MSLLATRTVLTLEAAKHIAAAAAAEARRAGWNVVIAVVDEGAHLLYLERMDNVQVASVEVAIAKARCSISFRRPTKAFCDAVNGGLPSRLSMPGVLAVDGGVPIMVGDAFVGAIGVSGVKPEQDAQVAQAGADAGKALA